jgi:hypothetical protein
MTELYTEEPKGEGTLLAFYQRMARELDEASRDILNHLVRSLIERGWLPSVQHLLEQMADHGTNPDKAKRALGNLGLRRLLQVDPQGQRITGLLTTLSMARTEHRGHLKSGVDVYTHGGVDLLALGPMLATQVECFTRCGQCRADLKLRVEGEQIAGASPSGIAGFQANWDGHSPIHSAVTEQSPLFCSDTCLETWTSTHAAVDGLPLSGDLLLFVGMGMAQETGHARFQMFGHC